MGTSKKRYIELHGEEAWKERMKKESFSKRKYRENNREKLKEAHKVYYSEHREEYANAQRDYLKTQEGRAKSMLGSYKRVDKESGTGVCTLTQRWILDNIYTSTCTYCGESDWTRLGCDRVDNTLPHTPENCICACMNCNSQRGNRWTVEEFIAYKQKGDSPIAIPTS